MLKRILIANRGEIAVRVIRACRELNRVAIAVYSEVDRTALHVRLADEAYFIGPSHPLESYLNIERILDVARKCKADAIHPGYGFLSENPEFARAVTDAGFVFIGPSPETMSLSGDKVQARRIAMETGVPVIPGTDAPVANLEEAIKMGREIGYPLMLKAAAGGGGKGMRIVQSEEDLKQVWNLAKGEALSAFGDDRFYIERKIERPRHIEMQILADAHGHVIWLGERECSLQRRHQKVIEEAPSPVVTPDMRAQLGEYAVRLARAIQYTNAGTIEFLMDENKRFYFLEVNARIQVEHPVTEMVTGLDLVKWQIRIAEGACIDEIPHPPDIRGHAIECRVYAEDPFRQFLPSAGEIKSLRSPGGPFIREDSGIFPGWSVPVEYDPLLSKLVVWGETRTEAIVRMSRALEEYQILGISTTLPLYRAIMKDPEFIEGNLDTGYLDRFFQKLDDLAKEDDVIPALVAAIAHYESRRHRIHKPQTSTATEDPWLLEARLASLGGGTGQR